MAFQFVHVATYSIKSGGEGVAAEAGRKPDHCRHVDDPHPPVLLAGVEPVAAWAEVERRHAAARITVDTRSGPRERKLRKDENVLLAAVASWPGKTEDTDIESTTFQQWQRHTLEFFEKHHGPPLSAVLHLDESHPHIHFLTAPDLENGQRMPDLHPGERAKRDAGGRNGKRVEKNEAYKAAMRSYQDDFFESVGIKHGMARLGPKVQRLSRDEWKAQQAEAQRQAALLQQFAQQARDLAQQVQALDQQRQSLEHQVSEQRKALAERQRQLQQERQRQERAASTLKQRETAYAKARDGLRAREAEIAVKERQAATWLARTTSILTFGQAGVNRKIREAQAQARAQVQKMQRTAQKAREAANSARERVAELEKSHEYLLTEGRKLYNELEDLRPRLEAAELDAARVPDLKKERDNWRDLAVELGDRLELFTPEELKAAEQRHAAELAAEHYHDSPSM